MKRQRVCIIQPVMKAYRLPFFTLLDAMLRNAGIDLVVQYGRPWPAESLRGDNVVLPQPLGHESVNLRLLGARLLLQPTIRPWLRADLVVLEHANKHLHNHLIRMLRNRAFGRLAYWGHGRNRQGVATSWSERLKRRTLLNADWWFAYTSGTAEYIISQGYEAERITVVQNAIDTRALRFELGALSPEARERALSDRGWKPENRIAIYCGSLYSNKRLELMVEAGKRVHALEPQFRLLVVGGGPMAGWMAAAAEANPQWLRYEGPKFGADKAECLSLAQVFMNPGLVGLGILDAFCAGLPLLTTDIPDHSPEIEYLSPGRNGLVSAPNARAYAADVLRVLLSPATLQALREGALEAGRQYNIESMAKNFATGVVACLARD